jgi:hypothetical protein
MNMIAQLVLNGIRNDIESAMNGLSNRLANETVTRIADRKLDSDAALMQEVKKGISAVLDRAWKMESQADQMTKTLAPLIAGLPSAIQARLVEHRRELKRTYGVAVLALAGVVFLLGVFLFAIFRGMHVHAQWVANMFGYAFAWFKGGTKFFGLIPLGQ